MLGERSQADTRSVGWVAGGVDVEGGGVGPLQGVGQGVACGAGSGSSDGFPFLDGVGAGLE